MHAAILEVEHDTMKYDGQKIRVNYGLYVEINVKYQSITCEHIKL